MLENVLWIAPVILQAVVAIIMWFRGLHRRLPYFFIYATYIAASNTTLMAVHRYANPHLYFEAYWIQETLCWLLGFAVIYEIYANLLIEYAVLQKLGKLLFSVMSLALISLALWTAFTIPSSDTHRLVQTMLTLERSVRMVQCGLLIVLFIFASFFGLSWKNYLFGIALGFSIFLSMELAAVAIRTHVGQLLNRLFSWLQLVSYNLGVLVWTYYVAKRWRVEDLRLLPKTQLSEWNETLQELLHR